MPRTDHFTCDCCGVAKKDTNHWFIARVGDAFHLYPWTYMNGVMDDGIRILFLCGDACATKAMAEFMSELKRKQDESATTDGK